MGRQYTAYDDLHFAMSVQAHNAYDVSLGSVASVTAAGIGCWFRTSTADTVALINKANAGVGTSWVNYHLVSTTA